MPPAIGILMIMLICLPTCLFEFLIFPQVNYRANLDPCNQVWFKSIKEPGTRQFARPLLTFPKKGGIVSASLPKTPPDLFIGFYPPAPLRQTMEV